MKKGEKFKKILVALIILVGSYILGFVSKYLIG